VILTILEGIRKLDFPIRPPTRVNSYLSASRVIADFLHYTVRVPLHKDTMPFTVYIFGSGFYSAVGISFYQIS